ncbi:MAG: M14 family metallopeptidase, partial [Cyclobacteriaceae bacterium]|nr:M14 family metallopeptidase [Cyclobacteriaceae bacterium]
ELDRYKEISRDQALAKISSEQAVKNSIEGKAVIWIDGGLHATEVAGAQMIPELAYKISTEESREVKKIRDNVILILMPVMNPDGLDIVSNWYYRNLGTPFETSSPPWLYHHYIGHDNNRDWFMNNMPESFHVNDILYRDWYPQLIYNHHQSSPAWARIFIPPFSNPVNPRIHPGVTTATSMMGTVMSQRFAMEKKPGVVSHQGYSMWWNGGMRTVPYYHNMIGILTETGHSTPTPRYYDPRDKPKSVGGRRGGMASDGTQIFYPYPWQGGESHLRDAVDYMLTGSMAVLNYASDRKEEFLLNIYKMGRDAIEGNVLGENYYYHIPANQPNSSEAVNFVNVLIRGGIEVQEVGKDHMVGSTQIKKGDYIISTSQAFRPFLEDLLEKQNYPDQRLYPGGPPNPPYDLAGWTLPLQMGVEVGKFTEKFTGKAEMLNDLIPIQDRIEKGASRGYVMSVFDNASYKKANFFMQKGIKVYRVEGSIDGFSKGDFLVKSDEISDWELIKKAGSTLETIKKWPETGLVELKKIKIGLYKSWVSNMDEGWTRYVLTDYGFDWDTLHNEQIKTVDLNQYDAIILPDQSPGAILNGHRIGTMPEEFTGGIGPDGILNLMKFTENGGKLISFDGAGDLLIDHFNLPLVNVTKGLEPTRFFIPGSLLKVNVAEHSFSIGTNSEIAVSFSQSSGYRILNPDYMGEGGLENTIKKHKPANVNAIATYAEQNLLLSGWALGEEKVLGGKIGMAEVKFGNGSVILFGFRPQFRAQTRDSYRLFFNSLLN